MLSDLKIKVQLGYLVVMVSPRCSCTPSLKLEVLCVQILELIPVSADFIDTEEITKKQQQQSEGILPALWNFNQE